MELHGQAVLAEDGRERPGRSSPARAGDGFGTALATKSGVSQEGDKGLPLAGMNEEIDVEIRPQSGLAIEPLGPMKALADGGTQARPVGFAQQGPDEGPGFDVAGRGGQSQAAQLRRQDGGDAVREAAQLPLQQRGRTLPAGRGQKTGPIRDGRGKPAKKTGLEAGIGPDPRALDEKGGGGIYFLNGETSFLSTTVMRPTMPPTTVAMPQGVRKKGGTPFLQTR